jgi:hypothetical protein
MAIAYLALSLADAHALPGIGLENLPQLLTAAQDGQGNRAHHLGIVPAARAYRRSRPPIPTNRDHLFRSIATSVARVLTAPLDDGGDVSIFWFGQARREAVPVGNGGIRARRGVPGILIESWSKGTG